MDFAHPERLWLLLVLPPLLASVARGRRRRGRDWKALGQGGRPLGDGGWAWLSAVGLLVVALAQPRWGRAPAPPLPPGQDVILVVDTSRSMAAEDAIPNRLGVAVEAAESLVAALGRSPGDRAALVAFGGRGVVRCPLTENLGAVADALQSLRPGDVQPGGTNLGAALETALDAFDDEDHAEGRTIVLFSDGEDHAETWPQLLDKLRKAGVVVHAVAIGDPVEGHEVPTGVDEQPLLYHGEPVLSRRHDESFEALARATGGAVVRLGLKTIDLGALYARRIAREAKQRRQRFLATERFERFGVFVVGALAVGLLGSWPTRRRWLSWPRRPRRPALAALCAAAMLVAAGPGGGREAETAAEAVAAGQRAYKSGDALRALAAFERATDLDPGAAIPRYDTGAALFQLQRYAAAMLRYKEARERADASLRTKIDYALGNTVLALGDIAGAIQHYDDCLASPSYGAVSDAVRRDAAINRAFALQQTAQQRPRPDQDQQDRSRKAPPKTPKASDAKAKRERPPESAPTGNPDPAPSSSQDSSSGANGAQPPAAASPEERLAQALKNVREARRRRLADPLPPAAGADGKEW